MEVPLDDPLVIYPFYQKQFVLHHGATPSISDLYMETHTMPQMGLDKAAVAYSAIGWSGTLEL